MVPASSFTIQLLCIVDTSESASGMSAPAASVSVCHKTRTQRPETETSTGIADRCHIACSPAVHLRATPAAVAVASRRRVDGHHGLSYAQGDAARRGCLCGCTVLSILSDCRSILGCHVVQCTGIVVRCTSSIVDSIVEYHHVDARLWGSDEYFARWSSSSSAGTGDQPCHSSAGFVYLSSAAEGSDVHPEARSLHGCSSRIVSASAYRSASRPCPVQSSSCPRRS
jgi:hypothetical protein